MPTTRVRRRRARLDDLPPVAVAWLTGEPPPERTLTAEERSVVLGLIHFDDLDLGGRIVPLPEVLECYPGLSRDNPHQAAWYEELDRADH